MLKPGLFLALSVVPIAMLVGLFIYVEQFEGWGQWAAAPMLLLPMPVSLFITLMGAARWRSEARGSGVRSVTIAATVLAAVPLLWLGYRFVVAP